MLELKAGRYHLRGYIPFEKDTRVKDARAGDLKKELPIDMLEFSFSRRAGPRPQGAARKGRVDDPTKITRARRHRQQDDRSGVERGLSTPGIY